MSTSTAPLPHVLVIEDDQTLGELFTMVLEMLPIRHHLCASADEALATLAQDPADVIVTDLLLPGLDGRGLLRRLRQEPRLRGGARVVVMSGSVDETVRREMLSLGAWRVLAKPVTVKSLIACLNEAIVAPAPPAGEPGMPAPGLDADAQRALDDHFGGNLALFESYRQLSLQQFPRDIEHGDAALARVDLSALRHLAHNLKSVMRTLGREAASAVARDLEDAAQTRSTVDVLAPLWSDLRRHLRQMMGLPDA